MSGQIEPGDAAPAPQQPPELPSAPLISYATPAQYIQQQSAAWRSGMQLIAADRVMLPDLCVKCNAPATYRIRRRYTWHHPAIFFVLLINVLIYIVVAAAVSKRGQIELALCDLHRRQRTRRILWASLLGFGGLAAGIGGFVWLMTLSYRDDHILAAWCTAVAWIVALIGAILGVLCKTLTVTRIDRGMLWLKGCGADFLANFPVMPQ